MMSYTQRRARDRASRIAPGQAAMDAAGSAMGSLQREFAQTFTLVSMLSRQCESGAVDGEKEKKIWSWAALATVSLQNIIDELRAVNEGLSELAVASAEE